MTDYRERIKDKKRIVVKIGTSTLTHEKTGAINLRKMEQLVRALTDLSNQGKEVVLVSSGAVAVGRKALKIKERPTDISVRQACASVGQARLMMVYQKLFSEYSQTASQILMTKFTMSNDASRRNAQNTFRELLRMHVIPIVNENDTVSTDELEYYGDNNTFGDNDTLSAIVTALIGADLLILMSDIDGLFSDDPNTNPKAKFIDTVERITPELEQMAKGSFGDFGTGGMATKLAAAKIANDAGADMIITNGKSMHNINRIMSGNGIGTLFLAHKDKNFRLSDYISSGHI